MIHVCSVSFKVVLIRAVTSSNGVTEALPVTGTPFEQWEQVTRFRGNVTSLVLINMRAGLSIVLIILTDRLS